jgi:hypothetical protein
MVQDRSSPLVNAVTTFARGAMARVYCQTEDGEGKLVCRLNGNVPSAQIQLSLLCTYVGRVAGISHLSSISSSN